MQLTGRSKTLGTVTYLVRVEPYGFGFRPVCLDHCPIRRNGNQPKHEWCVSKDGERFCSALTKQGIVRMKQLKNGQSLLECSGKEE